MLFGVWQLARVTVKGIDTTPTLVFSREFYIYALDVFDSLFLGINKQPAIIPPITNKRQITKTMI